MPLISSLTGELFGLRRRLELFCAILHTKTIPSRSFSVGLALAKTLCGALSRVTCVPSSRSPENILLSNATSSGKTNNQYECLRLSSFSIATCVAWCTFLVGAHSRLRWNRSGERVQKSWDGPLIRTRRLLSCSAGPAGIFALCLQLVSELLWLLLVWAFLLCLFLGILLLLELQCGEATRCHFMIIQKF